MAPARSDQGQARQRGEAEAGRLRDWEDADAAEGGVCSRRGDGRRERARERAAGPPSVRAEIRHQISLVERELATDLALLPGTDKWSGEDLRLVSGLIVTAMVATAEELVESPAEAEQICRIARRRLLMVLVGALQWESR